MSINTIVATPARVIATRIANSLAKGDVTTAILIPAVIAIRGCRVSGVRHAMSAQQMLWAVQHIIETHPTAAVYLNHPDVVVGLAEGKFAKDGLLRKLQNLEEIDL